MTMPEFARHQARVLLRRLAYHVARAGNGNDPDTVHELRVSIRRFTACLRVFRPLLEGRRVRKRAGRLMEAAAAVRDRDVALALLAGAGLENGEAAAALRAQRRKAQLLLHEQISQFLRRDLARKWRRRLEL